MSIDVLTRIDDLDSLGNEWDDLVVSSKRASPFLLRDWIVPWWHEFGRDAQLQVICARESGRLVAALPLVVERRSGIAVAGFAGGTYTEIGDLVAAPDTTPDTARGVVDAVDADVLHLFGLPAGSSLAAAVSPDPTRLVVRAEAPVVSLAAGWDAVYNEKFSAQRRKLHRKRMRQLEREEGFAMRVARTPDELRPALEDSFRLHELRWRGLPDRSGFTTPAGRRFHAAAVDRLGETGAARIAIVEVGGRAIASYYWLQIAGRACGASMAYDPAAGRWSPGWIATLCALETAATEGATTFEFLGGTEEYKLQFADELAPLHEAFARPKNVRARAYMEARLAALRGRRALKRAEPVRRAYYGLFEVRRKIRPGARTATDT